MIGGETARRGLSAGLDSEIAGRAALGLLEWLRPPDGWLALGLLALNLCVVVLAVEQADWAPTPNLAGVLMLGMLTAFVFYRLPVWWFLAILPGLVLGLLTVTWQLSDFTFDGQPLGGAGALWDRLLLWVEAARESSINIDKAPFAFGLVSASWLMGYVGAWVFLRHRNFWGVFALSGLGLFSNLTFLPPNTNLHLGLYLFTALLLVARIQAVRRQSEWDRRGIRYDEGLRALTLSDSFFLAMAVIAVAFIFPSGGAWNTATNAYESLRRPLVGFEDDFNRLFAGLPARRDIGFRVWDDVMAFQGTISPATTHTLLVESPVPMYWKARTYDTYTGKGWISEHTEYHPIDYTPDFSTSAPPESRVTATYAVTPPLPFAGPVRRAEGERGGPGRGDRDALDACLPCRPDRRRPAGGLPGCAGRGGKGAGAAGAGRPRGQQGRAVGAAAPRLQGRGTGAQGRAAGRRDPRGGAAQPARHAFGAKPQGRFRTP